MIPSDVVSIQIEFAGELELAAKFLSLRDPLFEADRDSDGEYEYIYGSFGNETIEINRAVRARTAGVITHNNPSFFSQEALAHVLSSFANNGVRVLSYQTLSDVQANHATNVA